MLQIQYKRISPEATSSRAISTNNSSERPIVKELIFISSIIGQQGWLNYFKKYFQDFTIHFFELNLPKEHQQIGESATDYAKHQEEGPDKSRNNLSKQAAYHINKLITQHKISKHIPLLAHGVGGRVAVYSHVQYAIGSCLIIFGTRFMHRPFLRERLWQAIQKVTHARTLLNMLMPQAYATDSYTQDLWLLRHEDLSNELTQISNPTLLLWGDADTTSPLVFGIEAHKKIKGSLFRVITDGDAIAPYKPVPDALKELISTFLEQCK